MVVRGKRTQYYNDTGKRGGAFGENHGGDVVAALDVAFARGGLSGSFLRVFSIGERCSPTTKISLIKFLYEFLYEYRVIL